MAEGVYFSDGEKIYDISEEKEQELYKKSAIIFAQLKQAFGMGTLR